MRARPMRRTMLTLHCWLWVALLWGAQVSAEPLAPLPKPEGRVLVSITGNIGITNTGIPSLANGEREQVEQAEFDLVMLDSLPQHEFRTGTPWTTESHQFSGVLLSDLLRRVDAQGTQVTASAINEYFSVIDTRRPELASLLLATRLDGKPMRIRDKGPTWLMLPLTGMKEVNNKLYHELLIWQLRTLDVQ